MATAIWWIRRDLRLSDNQALHAALADGRTVIPLYILDVHQVKFPAGKRQAFLIAGLHHLDSDLRARGSRLIVRQGTPLDVLRALSRETQAEIIVAQESYSPYGRRRDEDVAASLPLTLTGGLTVHHPTWVLKEDGTPYTVFTPFSRAWRARPMPSAADLLPAPAHLPPVPPDILSDELPEANPPAAFPAGEEEAQRRLQAFVQGPSAPIHAYALERNRLDHQGTSELSPYLRFGMVSARQAVVAALGAGVASSGAQTWLNELIWREFYSAILYHFPHVLCRAFRADLQDIAWDNDADAFAAWCAGRTGYPIVDAAMQQLVQTGWMHNRARMIVASLLVKDLLVDWRWGERWFMEHLVDGDAAANNGGWQWVAGTGTDAAPYFRIFNPVLQAKKFDPDGSYVRRWLPELANVPTPFIHEPWRMTDEEQRSAGCIIGHDYPAPIIDRAAVRERTLAAYRLSPPTQPRPT